MQVLIPREREAAIRQEGGRVLVIVDGRAVLDLPWEAALALADALKQKGRSAEEFVKRDAIAMDQAILLRAGATIGLSDRADVQEVAGREAAYNTRLRRMMPGGVKSSEQIGRPAVLAGKKGH